MTMRHRMALWYGDQSKMARLSEIMRDPVLREAIDLHFAESRFLYPESCDVVADVILLRRQCETGGAEKMLHAFERFCTPPKIITQDIASEWDHMVPEFNATNDDNA